MYEMSVRKRIITCVPEKSVVLQDNTRPTVNNSCFVRSGRHKHTEYTHIYTDVIRKQN